MKKFGALVVGGMLALAGCAGSDGSQGPQGAKGDKGDTGSIGPTAMNGATGQKLKLVIDGVVTANNTATLTFTIYPAANVCPGGTCSTNLSILGQKTFYAQEYNANTKSFNTNRNFSFGSITFKGITADGNGAQYTATKASPSFVVENSTSAFVFGYVADAPVYTAPGSYRAYNSVASAGKVYGTVAYTSAANVDSCEKCHGAPYSKHGYRQAEVAGLPALPEFAACKVCHTDQRNGNDWSWYAIADDPAQLAADPTGLASVLVGGVLAPYKTRYAYTANIMNDVHNSHAFEFNYPQSMANCVMCHAGKLDTVLTDANFKPAVCKSCHPAQALAGIEGGRAPAMHNIWAQNPTMLTAHDNASNRLDPYYTVTADNACNVCHFEGNLLGAKTFAEVHKGYNERIYKDANGTRYDASIKTTITSASYDAATYIATVTFSVSGISSTAKVNPTVTSGLYGWNAKDFLVANSAAATKTADANDGSKWTATFNWSSRAALFAANQIQRIEIGVLPSIGQDPELAVSNSSVPPNLEVAVKGATVTLDVTKSAADARVADANAYGKKIVDPNKCNACHDALATTFHSPVRGGAGVVGCRLCHTVVNAGGHMEMQSRSIDSYVHGIHRMQEFDIKNFDPNNAVSWMRYSDHVEGNYPNFAGPLNCESCHYAGTYDVPDQTKSLPSILSASSNYMGNPLRGVPAFAQQIVGPAARACGACHRAKFLNEDAGAELAAFVGHTNDFGSAVLDASAVVTTAQYVEWAVGATTTVTAAPAGAQVERCAICHPSAGTDHQTLFNKFRNGTKP